jgi:hypothetical protein
VPHYLPTCGGMASSTVELTVVLAVPAPVEVSWCALCSYRSGSRVVVQRLAAWLP